jgi:chromosome segregation ATPase
MVNYAPRFVPLSLTVLCYNSSMGDVSLDMIWKRLERIETGQEAIRGELATLNESMRSLAKSQVSMQRDISRLNDRVTVLTVAVDEHPPAHI